ncbi:unnamed protein product [Rotaria magnacalcarata]|uniref:Uncharacterized protein n=1 Tax=Rotaria magnacalcarata TaxID=392030 RepID=A0A819S0C3_9BILA|nr:unnamed protein product [Rotaria magnacalcarata]
MNNTLISHEIKSITTIIDLVPNDYDSTGSILYIVVVLLWYSMGIVCMLGMQIKASDETAGDYPKRRAKFLIDTLRDQTQTKEILGSIQELVDKQKRDKLWDIYRGTTDNNNHKLNRDETLRIRNIEKQLAVINQNHRLINESLISPAISNDQINSDSESIIIPDISSVENRVRVRRRSSLDQQILERWKTVVGQCKTHEQLPWSIQKLMIRRHFRRHYKTMLQKSEQIHASMYKQPEYIDNPGHHAIKMDKDD